MLQVKSNMMMRISLMLNRIANNLIGIVKNLHKIMLMIKVRIRLEIMKDYYKRRDARLKESKAFKKRKEQIKEITVHAMKHMYKISKEIEKQNEKSKERELPGFYD